MFFSHTARSVDSCVHGFFRSHGVLEFSCFCCHLPFPDLPRPPALHVFFFGFKVHVVPQLWLFIHIYSCTLLSQFLVSHLFISSFCTVNLLICGVDIRHQAAWLAWYDSQLCLRSTFSCIKCQYSNQHMTNRIAFLREEKADQSY